MGGMKERLKNLVAIISYIQEYRWGRGKAIIGNKIYSLFHEVAMAVGFVEDAEEREK
jgi:hypothetical protein